MLLFLNDTENEAETFQWLLCSDCTHRMGANFTNFV